MGPHFAPLAVPRAVLRALLLFCKWPVRMLAILRGAGAMFPGLLASHSLLKDLASTWLLVCFPPAPHKFFFLFKSLCTVLGKLKRWENVNKILSLQIDRLERMTMLK